ncbi:LysR family transcriptional regulator ArgP [bacterium]|nr:LysR family transcriptional regulator ArgP [bacterium]
MIDYKLLEAMATVIKEGGFDKAAQKLHITQSAVSQRVKLLEEQTGQILLARTTPPAATSAGHRLLKHYLKVKWLERDLFEQSSASMDKRMESLAIGLNSDSLTTWFFSGVEPFLKEMKVTLDLRVDDQEETHKMLREGTVMGCISSREISMQGCNTTYLGSMNYRLTASPDFMAEFFPEGFTSTAVKHAPAVIFNIKDQQHNQLLQRVFQEKINDIPAHYVPAVKEYAQFITNGFGYGMLPDQQCAKLIKTGKLVDIIPTHHMLVKLYWHRWNLKSDLLDRFTSFLAANRMS